MFRSFKHKKTPCSILSIRTNNGRWVLEVTCILYLTIVLHVSEFRWVKETNQKIDGDIYTTQFLLTGYVGMVGLMKLSTAVAPASYRVP